MNIDTTNQKVTSSINITNNNTSSKSQKDDNVKFAEELNNLSPSEKTDTPEKEQQTKKNESAENTEETKQTEKVSNDKEEQTKISSEDKNTEKTGKDEKQENTSDNQTSQQLNDVLTGLKNTVEEITKVKLPETFNQKDENLTSPVKNQKPNDDKNKEDNSLINNDMNIQDPKEPILPQMNSGMNFNTEDQPFKEFVKQNDTTLLSSSEQDLAEEAAILSTMSENMAIARKNILLKETAAKENNNAETKNLQLNNQEMQLPNTVETKTKTVSNEHGIKKVNTKTNVTVETVVKYDNIIMNQGDVEFFSKLVDNGSIDMNTVSHHTTSKSSQISKTLADMLAKSMQDNQPVRIDFDNNISVIIKISKQGKISADFLPSSQVAEAYLKENLPLLRQRFDDNNIEYDELNQRRQRQDDDRDNRKKGRKDE